MLHLISTKNDGTPSNDDSCEPVANSHFTHWNSVGGAPNCGAVAIGGGGGVAGGDGTFYFISPEALDTSDPESQPVADAPNLYVSASGSAPRFVATLESSLTGPAPVTTFAGEFDSLSASPTYVAVDNSGGPSDGDIYVYNVASNLVRKFDHSGNLITGWGAGGQLDGSTAAEGPFGEIAGIAVGPNGILYVQNRIGEGHWLFKFSQDGTALPTVETSFNAIVGGGIAVDSAGYIYKVRTGAAGFLAKLEPSGEPYNGSFDSEAKGVAVDPTDNSVYVTHESSVGHLNFEGEPLGSFAVSNLLGTAVNPLSGEVYLDEGDQVRGVASDGTPSSAPFGTGVLSGSTSVTADTHGNVYATNPSNGTIAVFSSGLAPDPRTDNPAVVDSVASTGARHSGDFQTTSNGDFAAFASTIPLLGEDNARFAEVYRYAAAGHSLSCPSCNPTGARAAGAASLAPDGLSLLEDGRVFFNSDDALAPRDLDNRRDVYESNGGVPQLISTGGSRFDSSLLGASADATDVYFFTRDTLVPQDKNGSLVKLYDARAEGGFEFLPQPVSCKASDECHGPGSEPPGPLPINTITGNTPTSVVRCHKGQVKRHGRCISRRHRSHRRHSQSAHTNHGGQR